jgi:branched-chain amino acid transport system substrate-binding protein
MSKTSRLRAVAGIAFALVTVCVNAGVTYGPGASDTEIRIGQTMPYSGANTASGSVGKAHVAYFNMINERGGIHGRKIKLLSLDDGYNPARTVEVTRKLIEQDDVLLMFGSVGTASQTAVHKYLNLRKVPQLFITSIGLDWGDPTHFPWTMPFPPNQRAETAEFAKEVVKQLPDAKIGMLYQNDDYGKGYLKAFKEALGDQGLRMIVLEASYEGTDPSIDSQLIALQGAGANVLMDLSTPKFGAFAIRKAYDLGWRPLHFITGPSASVGATLSMAGLAKAVGLISAGYLKDPTGPQWQNDPGMKQWLAWMRTYYPTGDVTDSLNVAAYTSAQLLEYVLTRCGDDLSRENIMRQATNIKGLKLPMLLPGITINTSPNEYYPIRQTQLRKFDGTGWVQLSDRIGARLALDPRTRLEQTR